MLVSLIVATKNFIGLKMSYKINHKVLNKMMWMTGDKNELNVYILYSDK